MKKIILFGSGRSSFSLIKYLSLLADNNQIHFTVVDASITNITSGKKVHFVSLDIQNELERQSLIKANDIVLSLLPPSLHFTIAKDCVAFSKHFITASYLTDELKSLHEAAKKNNCLLLMECGLDPGIDHLSAMKELDIIKDQNGVVTSFKSYTGGLVAPESDDNPWQYKITWNPRNVVLAGQGTASYLDNHAYIYIPYHRLFAQAETVHIDGLGVFEGYINRDALKYIHHYGLSHCPSFLRGTLRKQGFCDAWNLLVQLGLTDDSYSLKNSETMTWKTFTTGYLKPTTKEKTINQQLGALIGKGPGAREIRKLKWLGLLDEQPIGIPNATPAQLLQVKMEEKLKMQPTDKDMIVMHHIFYYTIQQTQYRKTSTLVLKGENSEATAMAKTVGLPMAIVAELLANEKINLTGVHLPIIKELYEPILSSLSEQGISFTTKITVLKNKR